MDERVRPDAALAVEPLPASDAFAVASAAEPDQDAAVQSAALAVGPLKAALLVVAVQSEHPVLSPGLKLAEAVVPDAQESAIREPRWAAEALLAFRAMSASMLDPEPLHASALA